ncbi:hypothetical protein V6N12_006341 [Hibiscus sabdariffa]|uniref:Protein FAR1-RELATED SEQUENCE n=1 Tax=Hibiscus sabdariffa TaxID=183260 RepID=A0ABR2EYK6_9ROSI
MVGSSSDNRGRSSPSVISINAALDGLEFDSKEEAFSFYKQYAKSVGFSTIIKASRRSRVSGKFIDAKFVCTRYGNDPESPQPAFTTTVPVKKKRGRLNRSWSKTDCKAGMHVKRRQDGRWVVCSFVKEHNHDTFPDQGYYSRDDTCLALGMSTMQRSDSVSSFFDRYLQRKTILKEFLDQYKTLLLERSEEEAKADFETWHKPPGLKSPSLFEKQMASFYTHAVFKKFQVEVLGGIACHPRKESEEGGIATFKVQDFEKNQDFIVVWNDTTSDISCLCRGFEFNGFPCRHILIILQLSGVQSIPSQHILKRWTKDAKHCQTIGKQSDVLKTRMQRYNDLCQRAFKLGDEGSLSQESYNIVFNALDEALRKCESVNYSIQTVTRPMSPQTQGPHHFEEVNQNSSTTKPVKKIKTSLKRQGYPETEISNTGKCNNWQQVGVSNIRVPNLECSYESQESVHRMEQLNSRTPALDSCFGSQLMQGMGQLNSIGPPHDAHYITQQRMNGTLPFRPQSIPSCYDIHGLQDMDQPNPRSSQASLTKIGSSVERIHDRSCFIHRVKDANKFIHMYIYDFLYHYYIFLDGFWCFSEATIAPVQMLASFVNYANYVLFVVLIRS